MSKTLGRLFGISIIIAGAGCDQPPADCTTGHGGFAAKFTLVEGSKVGDGLCDTLKGEKIGVEKYNPSSASDPKKQDLTKAKLRIRSSGIGVPATEAEAAGVSLEGQELSSAGDFVSSSPDDNNVCTVPSMSAAALKIPAGAAVPEADIEYKFDNVRVFVTVAYPGTQLAADLTFRNAGCTAKYKVVALWPAIECSTDDDCSPLPDPDKGRDLGSGINPDFADNLQCDPDISLCVLKQAPEALR